MADTWINQAFNSLSDYEGFSPTPYWDVDAWRIGYGSDTVTRPDGTVEKVSRGTQPISKIDAGRDLARSIPIYAQTIQNQMGADKWGGLTDSMRAELTSTGYNYGSLPDPLLQVINNGGDDVDIATAIAKLGHRKGINNPERRVTEASRSLRDDTPMANKAQVAQNDPNDAFNTRFGTILKPTDAGAAAPAAPAAGATSAPADDPFTTRFGNVLAAPPTPAAPDASTAQQPQVVAPTLSAASGPQAVNVPRGAPVPRDTNKLLASLKGPAYAYEPGDSPGPQGSIVSHDSALGIADSGVARGLQDIGDTASVYGMQGIAAAAKIAADHGLIDPKIALQLKAKYYEWDQLDTEGRKQWEAEHPASTLFGIIPTDPASAGRIAGQIIGALPATIAAAPVIEGALGGLAAVGVTNPLLRTVLGGAAANTVQTAASLKASDQPVTDQLLQGAVLGGVFAGGAHIALHAGATIFDKLFGKDYKGPALDTFNNWLNELGITPGQAQAELDKLGPDATFADLDKGLQAKAVAVSSLGGKPTQIVKENFADRTASGPARTQQAVDDILGPAPDVQAVRDAVDEAASDKASPFYKAAEAKGTQFDASPVDDWITNRLKTAKGGTADALQKFQEYLYSKKDVPKIDPNSGSPILDANGEKVMEKQRLLDNDLPSLHSARVEMDQDIAALQRSPEGSARNKQLAAMQQARGQLDALLKSDPDFAAADQQFAQYKSVKESFDTGMGVFNNSVRADDLRRMVASATPEQLQMLRFGARGAIQDVLGKGTRGELAAADQLFGRKSLNQEKLAVLFPDKADQLLDTIRANATMRDTENKINARTVTADINKAQKEFEPKKGGMDEWAPAAVSAWLAGSHFSPEVGLATGTAVRGGMGLLRGIGNAGLKASNEDLARILSSGAASRSTITNALLKRQRRAVTLGVVQKGLNLGGRVGTSTFRLPTSQSQ